MKIRRSYVSNSSSSSFIATELISLDNFKEKVKEAAFEFLCEEYKKNWKVDKLTRRQIARVKKDLYNSGYWREISFRAFDYTPHLADYWPHTDVSIKTLKGKPCVHGDDWYLGFLTPYITNKIKGVYTFWG